MRKTYLSTREQTATGWAAAEREVTLACCVTRRVREGLPLRPVAAKKDVRPWYALHARLHR